MHGKVNKRADLRRKIMILSDTSFHHYLKALLSIDKEVSLWNEARLPQQHKTVWIVFFITELYPPMTVVMRRALSCHSIFSVEESAITPAIFLLLLLSSLHLLS